LYVVCRAGFLKSIVFITHYATCGVVNFYNAGVVTHGRRIGSWFKLVQCCGS
jgi:hypothetical protein